MKTKYLRTLSAAALLLLTGEGTAGLLAYYSFDNDFSDSSGSGNHLTVGAGTPTITMAVGEHVFGGGALDFNSSTGNEVYLNLSTPIVFGASDAWTVAFWARRRAGSDVRQGMVLGDPGNNRDFIWIPDNSSVVQGLRFRPTTGGDADFGGFADDGNFHHWVLISDGAGTITAYRDNVVRPAVSTGGVINIESVGQALNNVIHSMNGQIDELYIYDEAISATTVGELFTNSVGTDTTPPTLVGSDITDNTAGGFATAGVPFQYTISFSEDIDAGTFSATDLGNIGSGSLTIGTINEVAPGVFTVEVTPVGTGTLQLQILSGANITDLAGNPLDTGSAITDDSVITVSACPAGLGDPTVVAYYPFDSDFTDSSGNCNDLLVGGGTPTITMTAGEYAFGGGALDLLKSSNEFLVPTSDFSFATTETWSVSFWARRRPGAAVATGMVVGDNTTTDSFIWLPDNTSVVQGLRFRPVGVGTSNSNDYATGHDTNFHHWVVVADGTGTIRVYRDNSDLGTRTPSGGTDFDIKAVGSGYTGSNQIFDGQIDELYIFNTAISPSRVSNLFNGSSEPDTTPPMLSGSDIGDDKSGGPVDVGEVVTYTFSFDEDINESTFSASDLGNAGTATFVIGTITEISPGVFTVEVTGTSTGTLELQVLSGASIEDGSGNALNTASAITDDTTITVETPSPAPGVDRVRVILLAGQSNADGRADPSGLPTSPVNLQLPQADVDLYEGGLTTLQPLGGQFGPEITLGRKLSDELADGTGARVAIIKYGTSGTDLANDWAPGGDGTTTGDGAVYVAFQGAVTAGLAALVSAYPNAGIEIEGMLWVQGERDAKTGLEASYETNLTNFIADIRATYGADLPFVVSRLSINQTDVPATPLGVVRTAQTAVAVADPRTALVDTDTFGIKADNLHFDASGQQDLGTAAACELLAYFPFLSGPLIASQAGGDMEVTVNDAFDGFVYTLQKNPGLLEPGWIDVESKTASGDTVSFTYSPLAGEGERYFRVVRTQAP